MSIKIRISSYLTRGQQTPDPLKGQCEARRGIREQSELITPSPLGEHLTLPSTQLAHARRVKMPSTPPGVLPFEKILDLAKSSDSACWSFSELNPLPEDAVHDLFTANSLVESAHRIWNFPRPPLAMGVCNGVVWAVRRGTLAGVDGCAMIPIDDHPWCAGFPENYRRLLDIHGGISWEAFPWIGFETTHAFDVWQPEFDPDGYHAMLESHPSSVFQEKHWTLGLAIREAQSLARQLAAITV